MAITTLDGAIANAVATGLASSIELASNTEIVCNTGSTVASGVSCNYVESIPVSIGNSVATGITSNFINELPVTVASAIANGTISTITSGSVASRLTTADLIAINDLILILIKKYLTLPKYIALKG